MVENLSFMMVEDLLKNGDMAMGAFMMVDGECWVVFFRTVNGD